MGRPKKVTDRKLTDSDVMKENNIPLDAIIKGVKGDYIKARTPGQKDIISKIETNDIVFSIGPAGSGKSFIAVALAVKALKNKQVAKIVLTRPAVEAGEKLGFLPGGLKEKIDPYLRPLYDALEDMIEQPLLKVYMEKGVIEIVPLAYMRGRTLSNSFIILDEAQNTTEVQLKMFLTRLGEGSKMVITGDTTQIDLPRSVRSGLVDCATFLKDIEGVGFTEMKERDVVRHPLLRKILKAYELKENPPVSE